MKLTARLLLTILLTGSTSSCVIHAYEQDHEVSRSSRGHDVIESSLAPAPVGPYSQGIRVGDLLYVAGQIGMDPESSELAPGGVVAETRQALENVRHVLEAAGFAREDVVQAQVFLADIGDYGAMNEVYAAFFGDHRPARAALQVAALPRGARVEILVVAARRD